MAHQPKFPIELNVQFGSYFQIRLLILIPLRKVYSEFYQYEPVKFFKKFIYSLFYNAFAV